MSATPITSAQSRPQPTPFKLFRAINGFHLTEAISAAVELEIFTAIGAGHRTPAAIAKQCGVAERGARILCDFLVVNDFLTKQGDQYSLAEDTAFFLDKKSPAYMGSCTRFLLSNELREHFRSLADAVRYGGSRDGRDLDPNARVWVDFARSMAPMMMMASQGLAQLLVGSQAKPMKVLDIAAGHGLFGISIARANPQAQIVACDWQNVLEVAAENAKKFNVADRYTTLPGSIFDVDIGTGYDLILIPNFLHHFDEPTCTRLARKLHAALVPGGRVATLEFVPNEDRVSPPMEAAFALIMLADTPAGDAYTQKDLEGIFAHAGFGKQEFHRMPPSPHAVLISTRS